MSEEEACCPLVVLVGATGTGKSALAASLAGRMAAERGVALEIISADARQIFRRLSVGTAKPGPMERAMAIHHMLDVVEPHETYNAARYATEALSCAEDILARRAVPFLVGGSGLYIRAFVDGLFRGPGAQPAIRARLEREYSENGAEVLHRRLISRDRRAAGRIHPNDRKRVIRALEVIEVTGRPISELHEQSEARARGRFARPLYLGLRMEAALYAARVEKRVRWMLENGMVQEAVWLADSGLTGATVFEGLGYAEALALHRKEMDLDKAVKSISRLHRAYAKRQRTWFNRIEGICWLDVGEMSWKESRDAASKAICAYLGTFSPLSKTVQKGRMVH